MIFIAAVKNTLQTDFSLEEIVESGYMVWMTPTPEHRRSFRLGLIVLGVFSSGVSLIAISLGGLCLQGNRAAHRFIRQGKSSLSTSVSRLTGTSCLLRTLGTFSPIADGKLNSADLRSLVQNQTRSNVELTASEKSHPGEPLEDRPPRSPEGRPEEIEPANAIFGAANGGDPRATLERLINQLSPEQRKMVDQMLASAGLPNLSDLDRPR